MVSAGATAGGINISVVSPQSNPTSKCKISGVNFAQGGAAVTGDTVIAVSEPNADVTGPRGWIPSFQP